jgi:hypothetical protein
MIFCCKVKQKKDCKQEILPCLQPTGLARSPNDLTISFPAHFVLVYLN